MPATLAPAKINLSLRVTGRRDDGYHLLDSLVGFADFGDRLAWDPAGAGLAVSGPFAAHAPAGPGNLVLRAAQGFAARLGGPVGGWRLEKHLPAGAGLGGGSADAAAALKLMAAAREIDPADPALARLALDLGADVPVCLAGHAARMRGVGEIITPLPPWPSVALVLAWPGAPLSTPRVFAARSGPFSPDGPAPAALADGPALARLLAGRDNDLAPAARGLLPALDRLLAALAAAPGCLLARMSGSGSAAFGLFADPASAADAAAALAEAEPGWWARAGRLKG